MEIVWSRVLPVLISISIIILVSILRETSKTLASILATMPINIPLALWVVSADSTPATIETFTRSLFINILPTLAFLLVVWLAARAGWHLMPMIAAGYGAWAVGLGLVFFIRWALGTG